MNNGHFIDLDDRSVISVAGKDRHTFLQGLVSCDVSKSVEQTAVYGAFLTPQGKYLFDFFLVELDGCLLLDCEQRRAEEFRKRLEFFKLRSDVSIDLVSNYQVTAIYGSAIFKTLDLSQTRGFCVKIPGGAIYTDPRISSMGARCLTRGNIENFLDQFGIEEGNSEEFDYQRISAGLPNGSLDIEVGKSNLLECGFEELNGVNFEKGCYMGQELTARTKYRGLVKKRLMPVRVIGEMPASGAPITQDGKNVGQLRSTCRNIGIALIRIEALKHPGQLKSEDAKIVTIKPDWSRF